MAVIDELYRLAGIYNTCILCVLHFVPNGLKLRGHLGSELQRKAATILSIEKDDEPAQSVVKDLKVRDGSTLDVPLMLFAWDKEAGMHVYKGEKPREEKEKRKERVKVPLLLIRLHFLRIRRKNFLLSSQDQKTVRRMPKKKEKDS